MAPNGNNNFSHYSTPKPAPLHQASIQQQQPVHPTSRVSETNTNTFVGNKFNPNQFYGEDEEEERSQEEEDDGFGGWNMQQQPPPQQQAFSRPSPNDPSAAAPTRTESNTTPTTSQSERNSPNHSVQPQQQQTTTDSSTGNSSALSTNELLKLFGASPYVAETEQQTKETNKASADTQPEETNKAAADTQPAQQQPYELVLPLPDALSDDDSSVESDDGGVTK